MEKVFALKLGFLPNKGSKFLILDNVPSQRRQITLAAQPRSRYRPLH